MNVLGLLGSPKGLLAIGVLVLALAAWALAERAGRMSCKVTVAELEGEVGLLEADNAALRGKVETQNKAVAAWRSAALKAQEDRRRAEAAAAAKAGAQQAEIDRLTRDMEKNSEGKGCDDALREERAIRGGS